MSSRKEFVLGQLAVEFIKEHLQIYGHILPKYILTTLNLDSGRTITILPEEVGEEQLYDFEVGGVFPVPDESTWVYKKELDGSESILTPVPRDDTWIIATIHDFLHSHPDHLCIFEHCLAEPTDPFLVNTKVPYCTFDKEVYAFLAGQVSDAEIEAAIRFSHTAFYFLCVLTSLPDRNKPIVNRQELTDNNLKTMAQEAEMFFIGVYDGEGYLLWRKSD